MRKTFQTMAFAVLAVMMATPAWAALQIATSSVINNPIPANNNFASDIASALGTTVGTTMNVNSDITVFGDGTIQFFAVASESGYINTFDILGAASLISGGDYTEDGGGPTQDIPWDDSRPAFATISVNNGDLLSTLVRFSSSGGTTSSPGQTVGAGALGFGIFVSSGAGDPYSSNVLYFGYDDNGAGPDDNHDDLIVRAVFTPVPEPASLIVWGLLASSAVGLAVFRNRRRHNA
jgi:hypothetical protein